MIEGIRLVWIVVKDLQAAIQFYTEVVGMTLHQHTPEYGWAELSGPEGSRLGIAQENEQMEVKAGMNAVTAISVKDIDQMRNTLLKQNAKLIGQVQEVPGHVKMQTFADADGNLLQIVQHLDE